MQKPITISQREYIDAIVKLTNECNLPAFLKIDILEKVIGQLRPLIDREYQRDMANWAESQKQEDESDANS